MELRQVNGSNVIILIDNAPYQYASIKNSVDEKNAAAGIVSSSKLYFHIDQLQGMRWTKAAWKEISSQTIANSWKHTTILSANEDVAGFDDLEDINMLKNGGDVLVVEDEEFKMQEIEGIFENGQYVEMDEVFGDASMNMIDDAEAFEESDSEEQHVKQQELIDAMRLVIQTAVPRNAEEFKTMDGLSKMYLLRKEEMLSNRVKKRL
ncbi:hypothetical protein [Parasitella parasitica]|uniref:DDE-1 domain-containing protein n=1 Tax=Parasitella parasitica TaxID=35722 RepID=A0A0B7NBT9_9FUNG|nr:hypothetical protein [Parasitella parasitica]